MKVYSDIKKVYGPYQAKKDGRWRVVLVFLNGKKKTVSYPKYLMEIHLNRYLKDNETVDHKDQNPSNNALDNFIVIKRSPHIKKDVIRNKTKSFICPECLSKFNLEGKKLNWAVQNRLKGKVGPFCGRSCAGSYGKKVQQKTQQKLKVKSIKTVKYSLH